MIDIAMLTSNRPRITRIAIEELRRRTTTPHRLIVLDNGSEQFDPFINEAPDVGAYYVTNRGVHWGFNELLFFYVKSEPYYICTDPDIVPASPVDGVDWLARLIDLMERHPDYAAIACRPHVMIGDNVHKMFADAPEVVERGHVGAVLRIMRVDAVRDVGAWSDKIAPGRNNEERYICGKLRKAGWKVGYSRDVRVIHLFGDDDCGEDPWGYPATMTPQDHGHRDIWPPVNRYSWDRLGVDWETCI